MKIPILWVNHMAKGHRTFEWRGRVLVEDGQTEPAKLGIQNALLLFTLSSLGLVFAGGGLFAFCFVAYALIFG
jgi:hypothetical protein